VTNRHGYVRKVVFDSSNRIKSSAYLLGTADGRTTTFAYDPTTGWRTSITDPLLRTTTMLTIDLGQCDERDQACRHAQCGYDELMYC
jgi:hypothetical protein